jgi:tetraprenyl-beta-curcumene synthase
MSAFGDRLLTARMSIALVLANIRYWSTVAPLVRTQLQRWARHAERIPDPTLQEVALTNLREEGFNAQATTTLATLAPGKYRKPVVEAVVGLQVIYDYLDSLVELPLTDPLGDGRRLYRALVDAVTLNAEPRDDYYAHTPYSADDGYLEVLVSVVRRALTRLPCLTAIAEVSKRAAERCAEAQAHAHATSVLGSTQLKLWATSNAVDTGLQWREFLAGAASSALALHALIAAAANPHTSQAHALAIDEVYLSVSALATLLDGLIDYEQDMTSVGQPGYIRYYEDHDALIQGLRSVVHHAVTCARDTPNEAYHLMTLVGVAAYYTSAPTASSEFARPVTEQISRELQPLITPTLAVMRTWRLAKRLRRHRGDHPSPFQHLARSPE